MKINFFAPCFAVAPKPLTSGFVIYFNLKTNALGFSVDGMFNRDPLLVICNIYRFLQILSMVKVSDVVLRQYTR